MTDHRIAATTTWGPDVPCPHCDGRPLIPAPYWTKHLTRHHPETPMPEPTPAELTVEEARDLVDEMSLDLYRAQDAIEFVREMCALREKNQRASAGQGEVQTGEILAWLKGPQCGRQMLAEQSAPAPVPADVRDRAAVAMCPPWHRKGQPVAEGQACDYHTAQADVVLQVPAIAEALAAVAAVEGIHRGYCPDCGRGDAAPTADQWQHERRRAERLFEAVDALAEAWSRETASEPTQLAGRHLRSVLAAFDPQEQP